MTVMPGPSMPDVPHSQPDLSPSVPVHDARSLTDGGAQARIVLNGQVYSLRITRAEKLILTK